jgi:hypothetical protein
VCAEWVCALHRDCCHHQLACFLAMYQVSLDGRTQSDGVGLESTSFQAGAGFARETLPGPTPGSFLTSHASITSMTMFAHEPLFEPFTDTRCFRRREGTLAVKPFD